MAEGWFRVHRSVSDHPILAGDPACRIWAWLDLVGMAAFEPGRRRVGHDIIQLGRGEVLASVRYLSTRWGWDKSKTARFLAMLKGETMIDTARETPAGTVYRVVRYEEYQSEETPRETARETESETRSGQLADTSRDGERTKVRREKKQNTTTDDSGFALAWSLYPKRRGGNPKASALRAWNARLAQGVQPEEMIEGVRRYAAFIRSEGRESTPFVKQAATFFGPDEHWREDYSLPDPEQRPATSGKPDPWAEVEAFAAAEEFEP